MTNIIARFAITRTAIIMRQLVLPESPCTTELSMMLRPAYRKQASSRALQAALELAYILLTALQMQLK